MITTTMAEKKKTLQPIDILRNEKRALRRDCLQSEARMGEQWAYLHNNVSSLLFSSAIDLVRRRLGFGSSRREEDEDSHEEMGAIAESMNWKQKLMSGFMASAPMLWNIAQPLLIKAAVEKVKSFFFNNDDEDNGKDKKRLR